MEGYQMTNTIGAGRLYNKCKLIQYLLSTEDRQTQFPLKTRGLENKQGGLKHNTANN